MLGLKMDFNKISRCPYEQRVQLFSESLSPVLQASIPFVRTQYHQAELLVDCIEFVQDYLLASSRSDFGSLERVWLFPVAEAQSELELAFRAAISGMYKSVHDHLRRAIEITVVGSYFLMDHVSEADARSWLRSKGKTPPFTRAISGLLKNDRFAALDSASDWADEIKQFYWYLSDAIHVRGSQYSLQAMQPSPNIYNGIPTLGYSEKHLSYSLDQYITAVSHILVCRAAENPIILVGLPLEEKFGINGPISGFFENHEAEKAWRIIHGSTITYFNRLVESDREVCAIKDWINELPDISEDEFKQQLDKFQKNFINGA
jgi:hypothetical protein